VSVLIKTLAKWQSLFFLKKLSPTMDGGLRSDVCIILLQQGEFLKSIVKLKN
jgi:hypothetical protein